MLSRYIRPTTDALSLDQCCFIKVPRVTRDDGTVWQVYHRKHLSSMIRTSTTVLLDDRKDMQRFSHINRIKCTSCPGRASNRGPCSHESACMRMMERTYDFGDENDDDSSETAQDDNADDNASTDGEEEGQSMVSYSSTKRRPFFSCSDGNVLRWILETAKKSGVNSHRSICLQDEKLTCWRCNASMVSSFTTYHSSRRCNLRILHRGTITVPVVDMKCILCSNTIPYDVYDDALFCHSKMHIFTRELLD